MGVDASPDGVEALKSKDTLFKATPAPDPYTMAEKAVEVGYEIMQGKKLEETTILIPLELITRDNVESYVGWTK